MEVESLSGNWAGKSVNGRSGLQTRWEDVTLVFGPIGGGDSVGDVVASVEVGDGGGGESMKVGFRGDGVSVFKASRYNFVIDGTLDPSTGSVAFTKKHTGQYHNTLSYEGTLMGKHIIGELAGDATSTFDLYLDGKDAGSGEIECLAGVWEGFSTDDSEELTMWTDTTMAASRAGCVTGAGMSRWKGEEIPFELTGSLNTKTMTLELRKSHKGKFTSVTEFTGRLDPASHSIVAKHSRGSLNLVNTRSCDPPDALTAPASSLERDARPTPVPREPPRPPGPPGSAERKDGGETPAQRAAHRHSVEDAFSGIWEGSSTADSGDVTTWRHVALQMTWCSDDEPAEIVGRGESQWQGLVIPFELSGTLDPASGVLSFSKKHAGRYPRRIEYSAVVANWSSGRRSRIAGAFDGGVLELGRRQDLHEPLARTAAEIAEIKARLLKGSPVALGDLRYPGSKRKEELTLEDEAVRAYAYFVKGVLTNRCITPSQKEAVANFRRDHGITATMHQLVLLELGYTDAQLEVMASIRPSEVEAECIICYAAPRNTVLIPCGHRAICLDCSKRLTVSECPICRDAFTRVQQIFDA